MDIDLVFYYTGLVFWIVCLLCGAYLVFDFLFWKFVDVILLRMKLKKEFLEIAAKFFRERNKRFPG